VGNRITDKVVIRRALISSWRKEPAIALAGSLKEFDVSITASGGTADAIYGAGIDVERLSDTTGFDNLLGGRVKTLHPAVYAAILARRDSQDDIEDLLRFSIKPIDLVAVDLYPFPDEPDNIRDAVELIDIGGVSLVRAAAKNFEFTVVLYNAEQFSGFINDLKEAEGVFGLEYRRKLAHQTFRWISEYDARIASGLS